MAEVLSGRPVLELASLLAGGAQAHVQHVAVQRSVLILFWSSRHACKFIRNGGLAPGIEFVSGPLLQVTNLRPTDCKADIISIALLPRHFYGMKALGNNVAGAVGWE